MAHDHPCSMWYCCHRVGGRGGGWFLAQVQGGVAGVFSFMAAASWAFCSLYFWIFR